VRRVSVVGKSGAGKTSLAVALARAIGAPHLELDAVWYTEPLANLFRRDPHEAAAQPGGGTGE
jgi:adenylate kinase family enzyme